tara:strand:+ start:107 stop:289 length:183 start_codon:yes stop_codon:yes gene_type:complete
MMKRVDRHINPGAVEAWVARRDGMYSSFPSAVVDNDFHSRCTKNENITSVFLENKESLNV